MPTPAPHDAPRETPQDAGASPSDGQHPRVSLRAWTQQMDAYTGPSWHADAITVFVSRGHRGGRPSYEAEAICPLGT